MVFIVKFMIGWAMFLLILVGIAACKMKDDPTQFWRDPDDDTSDDNDYSSDDEKDV